MSEYVTKEQYDKLKRFVNELVEQFNSLEKRVQALEPRAHTALELETNENNARVKEVCPWCHGMFKPEFGTWYFLKGTMRPVCEECIKSVGLKIEETA
jgi:hypothetical protein